MFYFVEGSDSREILYNAWCVNWPVILVFVAFLCYNRSIVPRWVGFMIVQSLSAVFVGSIFPFDRNTWIVGISLLILYQFIFVCQHFQRIM